MCRLLGFIQGKKKLKSGVDIPKSKMSAFLFEEFQIVPGIMESTATENVAQENQTQFDDDAATGIVDLRKVRDQYDIFQNSFKGKYKTYAGHRHDKCN